MMFARYLLSKEGAWLVIPGGDSSKATWTVKREDATPLLKAVALLWRWDLGGELEAVKL